MEGLRDCHPLLSHRVVLNLWEHSIAQQENMEEEAAQLMEARKQETRTLESQYPFQECTPNVLISSHQVLPL